MSLNGEYNRNSIRQKDSDRGEQYQGVATFDYDDSRDEKPWQRVPSTLFLVLLGAFLLLTYLTQVVEDDMPRVLNDADIARDNTNTFSEETAWRYLRQIVGDGPRVAGTAYHLEKTRDMKTLIDGIAAEAVLPVRTDWQMASGDYYLGIFANPVVNCYENASNVIALLEGESGFHSNGTIGTSVLINCHYDSVPYAQGASDDALFCAVMAETLSKLSRRRDRFKNNIIFLFNGAEENSLQASHAFLQHPWARGITAVVNLEAAGMNGKPSLFQVSDPRVLSAYRRTVSKPSAQGLGEFLFASGIIPSDTDFRIWRDFGQFYGVDIAFSKMGHVYHTRYDHVDLIKPGVIQCAGNMLLPLVEELGNMQELENKADPSAAVYYDYLNLFVVAYSITAAHVVDAFIFVLAVLSVLYYVWLVGFRLTTLQELLYAAAGRVLFVLVGAMVALVFIYIMVAVNMQLRYLTQAWIVVPLYWLPFLIAAIAQSHYYDAWRCKKNGYNRLIRTLQAMAAARAVLSSVLLLLLCIPALATMRYVISVPLFFMSITSAVSITVVRYLRLEAWQHLIMEFALSLPGVMFVLTIPLRMDAMLLPTMGRSPNATPDLVIGVLNVALAALVAFVVSGIELLFSRKRLWMVLSLVGAVCFILMFIPFNPYNDDGPSTQRHYWFHTEIITYNENNQVTDRISGVYVSKHDVFTISTMKSVIEELSRQGTNLNYRTGFDEDCETYVFCNLPLYRRSFAGNLRDGLFLYTGAPNAFQPAAGMQLLNRQCVGDTCTYSLRMISAPHNMLTIWPVDGVNLTAWTLDTAVRESHTHRARPVYVMVHSVATYSQQHVPLDFNVTFTVPLALQSRPVMQVSHHAHKINHPEDYTGEYRNLVNSMPRYFNIASFMTFRNNYVF